MVMATSDKAWYVKENLILLRSLVGHARDDVERRSDVMRRATMNVTR